MVEATETEADRLELALGPDVPSKMVFVMSPACALALIAVVSVAAPWLSGPAVVVAAVIAWYGWRSGRATRVGVAAEWVRVQLPIRCIEADWGQVSAATVAGGLKLTLEDGSRFTSSVYSQVLGAGFLARRLHLGRKRLETSRSLERALRAHISTRRSGGSVTRSWHRPSWRHGAAVLAVAIVSEVVALSA